MKSSLSFLAFFGPICTAIAAVLMVIFFGFDVTERMDEPPIPIYIQPAGYAFAIWLPIYLGFIALGIYQRKLSISSFPEIQKARRLIIFNSLFNILWFGAVLANQLWLTVIFIVGMLITLAQLSIIFRLGVPGRNVQEKWYLKFPLALYFGWITVATPVNITSFLITSLGWTGQTLLRPEVWSILILLVASLIITFLFLSKKANAVYVLVGVWGFIAIYITNLNYDNMVADAALILAILLLLLSIALLSVPKKKYAVV